MVPVSWLLFGSCGFSLFLFGLQVNHLAILRGRISISGYLCLALQPKLTVPTGPEGRSQALEGLIKLHTFWTTIEVGKINIGPFRLYTVQSFATRIWISKLARSWKHLVFGSVWLCNLLGGLFFALAVWANTGNWNISITSMVDWRIISGFWQLSHMSQQACQSEIGMDIACSGYTLCLPHLRLCII